MPSNQDASPANSGLKRVRVGFHVAGYTLRTLGNLVTFNQGGKLVSKISDAVQGYKRIPSDDKTTFNVGGTSVEFPSRFMGEKIPPGKTKGELVREVQNKINAGERLLNKIENGTATPPCTVENMTDIMTYLQARAQAEHGHHSEGSMSIPDPGNRIKSFLDTSPDAYQRKSSHIGEFQNDSDGMGTQRGIDAFGRTKNPKEMLPNNMKTVMYGTMKQSETLKMGENRLWLKMEPHGAWAFSPKVNDPNGPKRAANAHDGKAAVGHTFSFLETRGQGSKAGTRKERIPSDIAKEWKAIQKLAREELKGKPGVSKEMSDMVREGEGLQTARGVRFISSYMEELQKSPQFSEAMKEKVANLQSRFAEEFPQDTLNVRIGNEVILKGSDLRPRGEDRIPPPIPVNKPHVATGIGSLGKEAAEVGKKRSQHL